MLAAVGVMEMMNEESTGVACAESAGEMDVLQVLVGAATELSKGAIGSSNQDETVHRRGNRVKRGEMHNGTGASKKAVEKTDTSAKSQQKEIERKKPIQQNSPPPAAAEKEDHVHLSVREKSKAITPQEGEEAERKKKVRVTAQI
jgi:hypothetical protein